MKPYEIEITSQSLKLDLFRGSFDGESSPFGL